MTKLDTNLTKPGIDLTMIGIGVAMIDIDLAMIGIGLTMLGIDMTKPGIDLAMRDIVNRNGHKKPRSGLNSQFGGPERVFFYSACSWFTGSSVSASGVGWVSSTRPCSRRRRSWRSSRRGVRRWPGPWRVISSLSNLS